jgi:two-component system sensor histidine kinase GlrK
LFRYSTLHVGRVNLNELIEKVSMAHELAIMAKHIKLESNLIKLTVSGDQGKLMVIVDNLLSNAVKFSPYGGRITINMSEDGINAVLDVIDSGPGIDPADKEKVFDPFYQGRVLPQGHVKGTGIGLSVAAEYVRLHGGKIEIIDVPAEGANLRVTLPIQSG